MRRDLHRRLAQLEEIIGAPSGCAIIRIRGGLPDADGRASAGALRFRREQFESEAAFEYRVLEAALEAGEPFVVFGGLPNLPD
jgi:hypothetical protein